MRRQSEARLRAVGNDCPLMQPDDEFQTTLSKWPFILGDVLLVATALAIAILGDWRLTNWQVVACVLAVALGAGLFVLPYIVEFYVRAREEAEDRSVEMRVLERHLANAENQIDRLDGRVESLAAHLSELDAAQPEMASGRALKDALAALEAKVEPLDDTQRDQQAELASLAERIGEIAESIAKKPNADQNPEQRVMVSKPVRAPRKRRKVEPRLLQRAIEQKQDNASAAVSRIIRGPSKAAGDTEIATTDGAQVPTRAEEPEASKPQGEMDAADPVSKPLVEEGADETENEAASETASDSGVAPSDEGAGEAVKQSMGEPPTEPSKREESEQAPPTPKEPDMFAESVPAQIQRKRRTKKRDTAVIASVFIGIGNKPYLRGGGAGLNWEQGVPMEFEEIGKWRWIAPDDLMEAIEVQVYRNDEDADRNGKCALEPGQQLEISPEF